MHVCACVCLKFQNHFIKSDSVRILGRKWGWGGRRQLRGCPWYHVWAPGGGGHPEPLHWLPGLIQKWLAASWCRLPATLCFWHGRLVPCPRGQPSKRGLQPQAGQSPCLCLLSHLWLSTVAPAFLPAHPEHIHLCPLPGPHCKPLLPSLLLPPAARWCQRNRCLWGPMPFRAVVFHHNGIEISPYPVSGHEVRWIFGLWSQLDGLIGRCCVLGDITSSLQTKNGHGSSLQGLLISMRSLGSSS